MKSFIPSCLALAATLAFSTASHADKTVAAFGAFTAVVANDFRCSDRVSVSVKAASADAFSAKRTELTRVVLFAKNAIEMDCAQMTTMAVSGTAGGKTVYNGTADAANQWQLVDAAASPTAAAKKGKAGGDAFDAFRDAGGTKPAPSTSATAAQAPGKAAAAPLGYHCAGNLQRYTGSQVMATEQFEFRGEFLPADGKFRVINVMRGALFSAGSSYPILSEDSGVVTIAADSTNPRYKFQSLQLDRVANKLTGKGGVSLDDVRARVRGTLGQLGLRSQGGGSPMGTDGLDGMRRVEIDGACAPY